MNNSLHPSAAQYAASPHATLLVVRHGETNANVTGAWQGSTDSALTERGHLQAQLLTQRLANEGRPVSTIYTSPLGRARQTATTLAAGLDQPPIVADARLAEFHLGEWEGLSYDDLRFEKKLWERMAADPHFTAPGGESAVEFATRLLASFRTIANQHPGETTVIVSHGGAIATALAMIVTGDGGRWLEFQVANCGLTEIAWGERPELVRLNDTAHLDGAAKPQRWGAE